MKIYVMAIGIICIIIGLGELFIPSVMREIIKKVLSKTNHRIIGFVPLLIGILLFYAGGDIQLVLVVKIIGLLTVLKGLVIIFGPADKHRGLIGFVMGGTDNTSRLFGIITLCSDITE
ncbi:MAG: DUF2065 family protein [Elusimicrobiota bacterium]